MLELIRTFFGLFFWMPTVLLLLRLKEALDANVFMAADDCKAVLFLTACAAGAIWMKGRSSVTWSRAAFAVLTLGLLPLLFVPSHYSAYAAVLWCVGFFVLVWQRHLRQRVSQSNAPSLRPENLSASAPAQAQPGQAVPLYNYDNKIQRARYTFADIVGMTATKNRLRAAAAEIVSGNGSNRNGMMLFGEPGNGKTLFAEALAGELDVPFFSIAYGDTASMFVNETPQKVKAVFEQARRVDRCVLFIDEYDSFVKRRDSGSHGSHSMDRDLTNVVLTETVALRDTCVVLIAATNYLDLLDGASIREGRFDYKIEIPAPDEIARKALLQKSIGDSLGFAAVDEDAVQSLAERWEGFSASRLSALGPQLKDMRRDGVIGQGKVTFERGMQAMRLMVGRRGQLPESVKQIEQIIMPEQSCDAMRDLAFRMKNIHNLEKIGGRIPTGLVFFGAPGTGKTQAAMSLAKAVDFAFLKTTGAEIMANPDSWDKLVREAKDIRPVIVFIDEADDILRDRRYSNVSTLTNRILTTLDGGGGRVRDIVYIAATNHFDQLDPAAIRGGRFTEKIFFDIPSAQAMNRFIVTGLKRLAGGTYVIMPGVRAQLTRLLAGKSIADAEAALQKMIDSAAVRVLREHVAQIQTDDVCAAARSVFPDQGSEQS
jgi:transitional endoplasmic reticulum ATPase